jgi:nitrate reductase NapD
MNISSAIVHAQPGRLAVARAGLSAYPGVEIHATSDEGRLIVTIEAEGDGPMAEAFDAINRMDGVLSASMVFHQFESDPDKEL